MIELSDINHEYVQGDTKLFVLKNLSLSVLKNNNVGVVGPSGSGKTTLLNIIGLLEKPKSGLITINNINLSNSTEIQRNYFRKKHIGFIFQNNQLLEDFNVSENVALPLILNGESKKRAIEKANVVLDNLGLKKKHSLKPGLLSGGEQQRVAVARALIKKPEILLADEPTGSLDDKTADSVFELLIELSKSENIVTLIATHNLKLIKKLDLSYKIEKGKLVEFL